MTPPDSLASRSNKRTVATCENQQPVERFRRLLALAFPGDPGTSVAPMQGGVADLAGQEGDLPPAV